MSELIKAVKVFASGNRERINMNRAANQQTCEAHLKGVADLVASVTDAEDAIAAAWLHDIVEDTDVTVRGVERRFGRGVAKLVSELTPVSRTSDGDRTARFERDKKFFANISPVAKTIKLADLIDTCRDLYKSGHPQFGRYAGEAGELANVLVGADRKLMERLRRDLDKYRLAFRVKGEFPRSPELKAITVSTEALRVFERAFSARDIAEPLLSFDCDSDANQTGRTMAEARVEVAGIRHNGLVRGYVELGSLTIGPCGDVERDIDDAQTVSAAASLTDVIEILTQHDYCFVREMGTPVGVISRADIQKPAVRMWLFGIITVAELEFTERVRKNWPDGAWAGILAPGRVEKAKQLLAERQRRREKCELADCLQLSDKLDLLVSDAQGLEALGFSSIGAAKRAGKHIESLRNSLAHSQDFVEQDWPQVVRLARRIGQLVQGL